MCITAVTDERVPADDADICSAPDLIRPTGAEVFWHLGCCNGPVTEAPFLMTPADREALHASLAQLRAIYADLAEHHAGICVLHLEAAIAALESRLRQNGASLIDELRQGLTATPVAKPIPAAE